MKWSQNRSEILRICCRLRKHSERKKYKTENPILFSRDTFRVKPTHQCRESLQVSPFLCFSCCYCLSFHLNLCSSFHYTPSLLRLLASQVPLSSHVFPQSRICSFLNCLSVFCLFTLEEVIPWPVRALLLSDAISWRSLISSVGGRPRRAFHNACDTLC